MKILLVKTFPEGITLGKATYNYQEVGIAKALTKKGHQCDILCCSNGEETEQSIDIGDGKTVTLYCRKALKVLKNGLFFNVSALLNSYDLLQASEYNQMYTWHMAEKYRDKMVVWHGPYYAAFNKRYNAMSYVFDLLFLKRYKRRNTLFLTKSVLATEYLQKKDLDNVETIGVGVDLDALTDYENHQLAFTKEIRRARGRKLLYVGRLEPRRNPHFLLDILRTCLDDGQDVSLVLIGRGDKGYVESFWEHAETLGVKDRIVYSESVEQRYMDQLYGAVDIFLLPTAYDIFGMVLLEAMYFGKGVITTKNGGSCMLIRDEENGFILDDLDAEMWCSRIHSLLEDSDRLKEVGRKAHEKIANEYVWDVLADKLLRAYGKKLHNS